MTTTTPKTQTCQCCGGDLPAREVWEANRNQAGDCDGTVDCKDRCRAFSDDDLWRLPTTTYNVTRYSDGQVIGTVELTDSQFRDYETAAQQPEGIIELADLPVALADLSEDAKPSTVVYLD